MILPDLADKFGVPNCSLVSVNWYECHFFLLSNTRAARAQRSAPPSSSSSAHAAGSVSSHHAGWKLFPPDSTDVGAVTAVFPDLGVGFVQVRTTARVICDRIHTLLA